MIITLSAKKLVFNLIAKIAFKIIGNKLYVLHLK